MTNVPARWRSGWSIALTMTLWYALFSFGVMALAAGILYWTLAQSMYEEDVRDLADNLNNARLLLRSAPADWTLHPEGRRPAWAPPHQPEIYLRVLRADGRVLTETPGMSRELPPPGKAELATLSAADGARHDTVSASGQPFVTLIVRVPGERAADPPQFLQVAMDREHDEQLLAHYRERLWLVFGLSLIVCVAAGYLIARGGMRPIEEISHKAARIRSTTLDERIATRHLPVELRNLADTFNSMLDRLEQSFRHISEFSDDVAHELRTPINNLRGEIEVALGKARSGEAYRETLGSCLEECARISRLIATLLFLARSDTSTHPLEREQIDVSRELATVEAFYGAAAGDAGIAMRATGAERLQGRVNRTLFQQAIGNLVSNAISHTPPGGSITIAAHESGAGLAVSVEDTGCGIAPEHLPRVFERFYRVDRTQEGSAANVGLGLAVVKSIASRHGGGVEIASEPGRGTKVKLTFPR
ncbi:MAG TPA: heavy metal sensor histidine kinase [Steroidobacteraceae bacterium]|jgi:two-component system heavy metal sensor histidine kinase CusS|nr:heavy metal sensor histidine kinase [Steroidobacteraceae bacterium]